MVLFRPTRCRVRRRLRVRRRVGIRRSEPALPSRAFPLFAEVVRAGVENYIKILAWQIELARSYVLYVLYAILGVLGTVSVVE